MTAITKHEINIDNLSILPVMATDNEHIGKLKALCPNPFITGVGPINAATALTYYLTNKNPTLPDLILCIGSAGSFTLEQGKVYQASHIRSNVVNASAIGFDQGVTPFCTMPHTFESSIDLPQIKQASLQTSGEFISGGAEAFKQVNAEMADMESYAIECIAARFGITTIHLRGISDGREESKKFEDWTDLLESLGEKLGDTTEQLFDLISSGGITKEQLARDAMGWNFYKA